MQSANCSTAAPVTRSTLNTELPVVVVPHGGADSTTVARRSAGLRLTGRSEGGRLGAGTGANQRATSQSSGVA